MGFNSQDDFISEVSNGKFWRNDWNKITGGTAYAAGRWYDLSLLTGTPAQPRDAVGGQPPECTGFHARATCVIPLVP